MKTFPKFSQLAIGSALLSLVTIFSLHFLSPELDPSWHMISEYAYGQYEWVLTLFFLAWAVSYWSTGVALWSLTKHWLYKLGIILILISGLGALMGGLFDVRHSLHGLAFALGIPFVPIVVPFMTHHLLRKYHHKSLFAVLTAHATWISFLAMAITMGLFISQMQQAGALNMETPQLLTSLPPGVTTVIGYANRFLVVSYLGWLLAINSWLMKRDLIHINF